MAFYQKQIESNQGGIINISSYDADYFKPIGHDRNIYDYYSQGVTEPSTVVVLNTNIPIIDFDEVEALFPTATGSNQGKPESYYASESYLALKHRLIDGNIIQWLWGNYDNGGVFYFAGDTDKIYVGCIGGFFRNGQISGVDVYAYNTGYTYFTPDQAKELRFVIEEDKISDINNNFIPFTIFFGGDGYEGSIYQYGVKLFPERRIGYFEDQIDSSDFRYVTGQCGYYADFPVDIPVIETPKYIFSAREKYLGNSVFPYSTAELISGNIMGSVEIESDGNPFVLGDYSFPAGGGGEFPNRSDEIDTTNPENFDVDVVTSGFLTLYNPTASEIINFNKFLFSDLTDGMINQLRKLTTEPLQYLIFMAMCHFEPVSNSREEISFAGIGSGVTANKISKQYKQINCGSVTIPEASKSFLDYGGFSKVSIFLPYCGIHQLNIDDVMGAKIKVVYNIDQLTGACLVQVKCSRSARNGSDTSINSVLYTFNGNCYETIPIFASDWRSAINAITGLVSGTVGAIATKDVGGLIGTMTDAVTSEKVKVNRSGSPSVSYGYMDNQKPYLILERPVPNIPTSYGKFNGYTTNIKYSLISLRGYTEVDVNGIIASDFECLDEELIEIKSLLEGGIYL